MTLALRSHLSVYISRSETSRNWGFKSESLNKLLAVYIKGWNQCGVCAVVAVPVVQDHGWLLLLRDMQAVTVTINY